MISRVFELYRRGGLGEVGRGIRDWCFYSPLSRVLCRLYARRTLEVNGVSVSFGIRDPESFRRSVGHGETDVIEDFLAHLTDGDVVWDVGANQGTYSLFAAKRGAEVHAFEPNPDAYEIIERNAQRNGVSIQVHRVALGSTNDTMVLREADRAGTRWIAQEGPGEEVTVRRGDDLQVPPPDVLKIDVEGAEVDVLEGMRSLLEECRVCYVEIHDDSARAVRDVLRNAGFEITDLSNEPVRSYVITRGVRGEPA
ncbi:MAG: FkbM family methyltransferase [Haloferacaceae archaeon]